MKFTNKTIAAIMLSSIIAINFSCTKTPASITDTATLLQNKNWKITALTISPAYFGITDVLNGLYFDCEKDDLYQFNSNGNFVLDNGATKCAPTDPQTQSGSWNYNSSNKNLHFEITAAGIMHDMSISSINESSFTGITKDTLSDGAHTSTWIFTKQ
jgi:hypothetical protein